MIGESSMIMRDQDTRLIPWFFPESKLITLDGGHWGTLTFASLFHNQDPLRQNRKE